jgi:hypothetical protein
VNNGDSFDTPMMTQSAGFGSGGLPNEISAQKIFSCDKHLLVIEILGTE